MINVGTMREIPDMTCCGNSPQKLLREASGFLMVAAAPDAPGTTVALRFFNGHICIPVENYGCSAAIISSISLIMPAAFFNGILKRDLVYIA